MRMIVFKEQMQKISQEMQAFGQEKEERGLPDVPKWIEYILRIAPFVQLALFVILTQIVRKNPILAIDIRITHALQKYRSPSIRSIVKVLTYCCGSPVILRTSSIEIALYLWFIRMRTEAMMTVAIVLSSSLIKDTLQRIVNRPRPSPLLVKVYQKPNGKSYPSGHVISSLTSWGWFAALYALFFRGKPRWQKALFSIPILFISLTGPTRIYLGDHWASDVLGGYFFGTPGSLCLFNGTSN